MGRNIADASVLGANGIASIPSGATATTQPAASNDAKVATDTYVDRTALEYTRMTMRGFKAWNADPQGWIAGAICVSQSLYVVRVPLPDPAGYSITGAAYNISTAGSSLTSGQNLVTLYNQAGTKQADSADQTTIWTTAGSYASAFAAGPYSLTGGSGAYCWISFLSNGTTPAIIARTSTLIQAGNLISTGLAATTAMWFARNGTAVTATGDLTLASNVATAAFNLAVALY